MIDEILPRRKGLQLLHYALAVSGLPGTVLGVSGATRGRRAEMKPLEPDPVHTGVGKHEGFEKLS